MNQELAGGTLGVRAAESARHFNQPEAWSTITTNSGVYQINRYTGDWRKVPIPITQSPKYGKVWDSKSRTYKWGILRPGVTVEPGPKPESSGSWRLIERGGKSYWINSKTREIRPAEGIPVEAQKPVKKGRTLTPTESFKLRSQALKEKDPVAAETYNDFQSEDSTRIIYYKEIPFGPDKVEEIQLPNIRGFQVTVGYLRRVKEKYGFRTLGEALDYVKQVNTPIGKSKVHEITAFGGK